jgi:hypothetical protein
MLEHETLTKSLVILTGLLLLSTGCQNTDYLWGKACDQDGQCLAGYVCEVSTNRCLWPDDIPDGGDDAGIDDDGDDAGIDDDGCHCPNCGASYYLCVYSHQSKSSIQSPGVDFFIQMDRAGYDPKMIVCVTDTARLIEPEILFANDFESDLNGFELVNPDLIELSASAKLPASNGSQGVVLCKDKTSLTTTEISTLGQSRILLQYAARAQSLSNQEFLIVEYSADGGDNWYVLNIEGDHYYNNTYQWYRYILPDNSQDIANLKIRLRLKGGDQQSCAYIDDLSVKALAEPTVNWTIMDNNFEVEQGNLPAEECVDETIIWFNNQGQSDQDVCLSSEAQNPNSAGNQGVRIVDNRPSYLEIEDIDTRHVPEGSDLIAEFWMRAHNLGGEHYAHAWYRADSWLRMNGVGLDTTSDYQRYRFVWDQSGIGITNGEISFWIPRESPDMNDNQGIDLDDFSLGWYRASHDQIEPFVDLGGGRYKSTISSDLPGTANIFCIYYGIDPPLTTNGGGDNSGSLKIDFSE